MPRRSKADGTTPTRRMRLSDRGVAGLAPPPARTFIWDTTVPQFCLVLYPSGAKSFKVVYTFDRQTRFLTIGPAGAVTTDEARAKAREVVARAYLGQDLQGERVARKNSITLANLISSYEEDEQIQKTNRSLRRSVAYLKGHVLPLWGQRRACDITRKEVLKLHEDKSRASGPGAANNIITKLSAVFAWGVDREILTSTPCTRIPYHKIDGRDRVLQSAELPKFWHATSDYPPCQGAALRMMLLTGQRAIEIAHMRWEHVSDEERCWHQPGKPDAALDWPGTKNGCDHWVWLSDDAWQLIQELRPPEKKGYVFPTDQGKCAYGRLARAMREISAAAGFLPPVRPHDLRRSHATIMGKLGYDDDAIDRVLNHKKTSIITIYNRYKYEKEMRAAQQDVANHVLGIVSHEKASVAA